MNEDGDYMDGYNDGFIDGRGTMLKPLRWRTGPVPEGLQDKEYLIRNINLCGGYRHRVGRGHSLTYGEEYIPLSEILELIGE